MVLARAGFRWLFLADQLVLWRVGWHLTRRSVALIVVSFPSHRIKLVQSNTDYLKTG